MIRLLSLSTLLIAALISVPAVALHAEDHDMATMAAVNAACPMCGKAIGADAEKVTITVGECAEAKKFTMACCGKDCGAEFKKDPEAAFKKIFGKGAPGPKTMFK